MAQPYVSPFGYYNPCGYIVNDCDDATALAQSYGGKAVFGRRKKKDEDEPTIEQMVRAVVAQQDGTEAVVAALPKPLQRRYFPDTQVVLVADLVKRIEDASGRVHDSIERMYREIDDDDDDEFLMMLF